MADLFEIGFKADTSSLKKGTDELGKLGKAADTASVKVDKYGNELNEAQVKMGRFIDKTGRMREANGRFVTGLEKSNTTVKKTAVSTTEMGSAIGNATKALLAYVSVSAAWQGLGLSDSYQLLNDRIMLATEATGDFAEVQRELFDISQETGTSLKDNVNLFDRIRIGAEELGRSNEDVLKLVTAIDQLGASGGTSSDALRNATTQFSQALAGGVLRAEEFNSIVENTPKIAQAIATGLDTSIGGLRQMVLAGEVLSEDVFESLLSQSDQIADNFEKMPVRLGRATTEFSNSITKLLGELDEVTGTSSAVAQSIGSISSAIDKLTQNEDDLRDLVDTIQDTTQFLALSTAGYLAYANAAKVATVATLAFNRALSISPLGAVITTLGLAATAFYSFSDSSDSAAESMKVLADETDRFNGKQKEAAQLNLTQKKIELEQQLLDLKEDQARKALPTEFPSTFSDKEIEMAKKRHSTSSALSDEYIENTQAKITLINDALKGLSKEVERVESGNIVIPQIVPFSGEESVLGIKGYTDEIERLTGSYTDLLVIQKLEEDRLKALSLLKFANAEDAKQLRGVIKGIDEDLANFGDKATSNALFDSLGDSFAQALASGDFSALSNTLSGVLSNSVSGALGGGFLGALGGGLTGSLVTAGISSLTSSYESVGTTSNLSVSGSNVSGYSQEDFKKSGMFGGSKSVLTEYEDSQLTAISNTITKAQRDVTSLLGSMGTSLVVGLDEFSTTVSSEDIGGAIDQITDEFLHANIAYIESFMDTNQTAIEALAEISEAWGALESSFDVLNSDALETSIDSVVTGMAAALTTSYENQITSLNKTLAEVHEESEAYRQELLSETFENQRGRVSNVNTEGQAEYYTEAIFGDTIRSVKAAITEANSRLSTVYDEAYTTFTVDLQDAVASVNNVDLGSAWDLLTEQVSNFSDNFYSAIEQQQNALDAAAEDLEEFSYLGVDSTTSLSEFREAFEEFLDSEAFTAEGYAQWIAASSALSEFVDASDGIDEVFEDITDYVKDLMGLSADGTENLASAQAAYIEGLNLAATGDQDAISDLASLAETYLDLFAAQASTSQEVLTNRSTVVSQLQTVTSGGDIPAFANGGNHTGGWRLVGERGPELEYTGASTIYNSGNTASMLDNSDMIGELKLVTNTLRNSMDTLIKHTRNMAQTVELWDNDGIPVNSATPINVAVV